MKMRIFVWQLLRDHLHLGWRSSSGMVLGMVYASFVVSRGLGHITSSIAMLTIFFEVVGLNLEALAWLGFSKLGPTVPGGRDASSS
jgi:hypothetical protein